MGVSCVSCCPPFRGRWGSFSFNKLVRRMVSAMGSLHAHTTPSPCVIPSNQLYAVPVQGERMVEWMGSFDAIPHSVCNPTEGPIEGMGARVPDPIGIPDWRASSVWPFRQGRVSLNGDELGEGVNADDSEGEGGVFTTFTPCLPPSLSPSPTLPPPPALTEFADGALECGIVMSTHPISSLPSYGDVVWVLPSRCSRGA